MTRFISSRRGLWGTFLLSLLFVIEADALLGWAFGPQGRTWPLKGVKYLALILPLVWAQRLMAQRFQRERLRLKDQLEFCSRHGQDAVLLIGADDRIQQVNPRALQLYGTTEEALVGLPARQLSPPDQEADYAQNLAQFRGKGFFQGESVHVRADGTRLPVELTARLLGDGSGGRITIVRDISQRQAGEAALRRSAERFRTLFETAPEPMALVDHTANAILDANPAFCEIYGYSREELLAMRPQDLSLEPAATLAAIQANAPEVPLRQHRRKDGTPLPVALRIGHLLEGDHQLAVLSVQDLRPSLEAAAEATRRQQHLQAFVQLGATSRPEAERDLLQEAMDLMAGLFDSPIGFLHFVQADQENLQLAVWTTATRPLCTAPQDIHYPISQAGIWVDAFRQRKVVIHNDYATEPHRKGVPEGHFNLVREMVAPVLEDNAVRMIIGVGNRGRPYTPEDAQLMEVVAADLWRMIQRNRSDLGLQEANRTLETQVAQRTQRLVNLNEELEAFSYSVSHDLRAPLRAVTGFAEALAEDAQGTLTDTQQDYLQRIQGAGQRMGALIEDLLTLSRLGRQELRAGPVDLGRCAMDIIGRLRDMEPQRRVELRLGPGLQAHGDPGLLRIVLENLLGNAWKFTGRRDQALIELNAGASEGGVPTFVIRDNGVGFPAHKADRLFTAFQRLHSHAEFPGTGIGLAMVRRIITRHGGTLWAEGREGQGATFYFTLPQPENTP